MVRKWGREIQLLCLRRGIDTVRDVYATGARIEARGWHWCCFHGADAITCGRVHLVLKMYCLFAVKVTSPYRETRSFTESGLSLI